MPKHCSIYVFHATHEPNPFSFFDISSHKYYFQVKSASFLKSPLYQSLSADKKLKVTCYFSGAYLESLIAPEKEIPAIKKLVAAGQIELLLGTYHHSFSCLFSSRFFGNELARHKAMITTTFDVTPAGILNTAAIFSNELIPELLKEQVAYAVVPRVAWYLGSSSAQRVVKAKDKKMDLLLVGPSTSDQDLIVSYLPGYVLRHWDLETVTASEAVAEFAQEKSYSLPNPVGLDPEDRDLTHFFGNSLQKQVFKQINDLAEKAFQSKDHTLQRDLMVLSSPAIFHLISQEHSIRYDYYTSLMNCLTDMELRLRKETIG